MVYTPGKWGRKVPNLLNDEMKSAMDLLKDEAIRKNSGVQDSNLYLFAVPLKRNKRLNGGRCLYKIVSQADLTSPSTIKTTTLRKYTAIVSQVSI